MISARVLQIVLVVELASAFSQNCRTNDSSIGIPTLYASSQQDLDHLDGCTNLTGNILLLPDYSGPFKLNGVTELNGGIAMNASEYSENVESFEMLDVVNYAGILELYQVSDVQLPKVERMQELSLRSYKGGTADLGRLVESELIGVAGVWETNLTSLRRVGTSGVIFSSYVINPWKDQEYGAIKVVLPALESAAGLNIFGRVSKLSLPRLANITRDPSAFDGQPFNSTISIETSNLDVQLPALTTLNYPLAVQGLVSTLNLSSLVKADQDIFVETGTSSDISFPVLERAQGIHLARSISSINAPVLRSATVLDISTYSRNPCTGDLDDVYIAPYDASKSEVRCPASTTSGSDYTPKPKSSYRAPLQPGTIAGIVLGCIGGVTGLAVVVICMRKKAGKHAVSPIQSGVCDDAPPPYSRSPL